ncbi:MAG: TonB-dependent receptor domain-containing protein [Bryobacteraceae bacterium]
MSLIAFSVTCFGQTGSIVGTIFDAANGQPIRQAAVSVKEDPKSSVQSDVDGSFKLDLPPGTYVLIVKAENFVDTTVDGVEVKLGAATQASTVMVAKGASTTVEVNEKVGAVAASAEAALTERKLAAVVSDAISADEIKKSVASDAAGAITKVTGVSIVDNGYVYVRGLGERYSATMLNNALIPTTEPEKRVVPLDLFPASLIDSIKVLKTYSPDLPGEFSGGLVQMQTIDFPTAPVFRVSSNFGFNSLTTGSRFGSYPGGGRDAFGFDDGTRSIPSIVPEDGRIFAGRFTPQQLQEFGRAFPVNWERSFIDSMRPTQSFSMVGGNTFGRFGLIGALTFSNKPQLLSQRQNYYVVGATGQPQRFTNYDDFRADNESARLGGVLNLAVRLNSANKVVFRNTLTRDTDKEGRQFTGYNGPADSLLSAQRLRWVERGLLSTSAEGEHAVTKLGNSLFRWQLTYSSSNRDEPDLRETVYGVQPDGRQNFLISPQSAVRFYSGLDDRIYEPQGEFTKPFYRGSLTGLFKVGFRGTFRRRDFQARRFRYIPISVTGLDLFAPANQLLSVQNINPRGFQIREETRGTDRYQAEMDVYAGYAMVDMAIGPRWRLIGGVRIEDASIVVTTVDPLVPGSVPSVATLVNRDPLPAVNLIYALSPRQNVRFAYGRTISRPDFRELSPFEFTNVLGGFNTVGNPNLKRAAIDNFDARWEWFLGGDQVIAASYFYKRFDDPIEVSVQPTQDFRQSFLNAENAINQGVELEFRRNLRFVSRRIAPFSIGANFTIVDSNVKLPDGQGAIVLTSKERPLVGQSRFIYNIITEWAEPRLRSNARFYVNSVSRRITDVGAAGLPDLYQERNAFLDFVYQFDIKESGRWNFRFAAENLGDNEYRWTQGGLPQRNFRIGRTFSVGTSFSFF